MSELKQLVPVVCEMLSEGKSLRQACRELAVSESSMRYWLHKDGESFAHSARARELGCDALADECLDIADDPTIDANEKRIRIDTRIRLIGKWSQRYSDKVLVKNETTVTHRYDLDSLDDARLGELERILADAARSEGSTSPALPAPVH